MMKELFDVIDCMRSKPEYKAKLGILQKWDPCLEPDLVVFNAVSGFTAEKSMQVSLFLSSSLTYMVIFDLYGNLICPWVSARLNN